MALTGVMLALTAVGMGYELQRFGIFPAFTPYSVAEGALTFCFPIGMIVVHAIFRPSFPYFHIGRELAWLGVAVVVSLIALVLGTLKFDALIVLNLLPPGYRPLTLFLTSLTLCGMTVFCEFVSRVIWQREQNRADGGAPAYYGLSVLGMGVSVYIIASVMLVTRST